MPLYVTPTPEYLEFLDAHDGHNWIAKARHAGGSYEGYAVLYLYRQSDNKFLGAVNPDGKISELTEGERVYAIACDPQSTPGAAAAQISGRYPASAGVLVPVLSELDDEHNLATADTRGFLRTGRKSWVNSGRNRRR